jgi:hypothetical protein
MVTEVPTTPEPQTDEPTITTPELITDDPISIEPIDEEITIPTDEPLSTPTNDLSVTDNEAMTDDSTVRSGGISQPLLIGTAAAAVSVGIILLSLTVLIPVIVCKKRSKSFDITQQSNLQLGVTNRLHDQGS